MEHPEAVEGKDFSKIKEGKAEILSSKGNEVFYNHVQEVNRDLSVAMIKLFQKEQQQAKGEGGPPLRILEALSATGLRAIRYAHEIPHVRLTANDMDPIAVEAIKRNVEHNNVSDIVTVTLGDAVSRLHSGEKWDVIDLDPYGTAAPFLPGAVQAVDEGGLLCITCTDLAVLCGNRGEACWSNYGGWALHRPYMHEQALRLVLGSVATHAARVKRVMEPLLSVQIDFYVRVFVRLSTSAEATKRVSGSMAHLWQCAGCDAFQLQPISKEVTSKKGAPKFVPTSFPSDSARCPCCGSAYKLGGPLWAGALHSPSWVSRVLKEVAEGEYGQTRKLTGLLHAVQSELPDPPLFYALDSLCRTVHSSMPSLLAVRSALLHAGWPSSVSHCNANAIKTAAPVEVLWDILRSWKLLHPTKPRTEQSPGSIILSKPPSFEANFTPHPDLSGKRVPMFIPNPANWGPGTRAGKKSGSKTSQQQPKKPKEEKTEKTPTE